MSDPHDKQRVNRPPDAGAGTLTQDEPTGPVEVPDYQHPAQSSYPSYQQPGHASYPNYEAPQQGSQPNYQSGPYGSQPNYQNPQQGSQPNYQDPQHGSQPNYQGGSYGSQAGRSPFHSAPTQALAPSASQSQLLFQKYQRPADPSESNRRPAPSSSPPAAPSGAGAQAKRHSGVASFRFAQPSGDQASVYRGTGSGEPEDVSKTTALPSFPSLETNHSAARPPLPSLPPLRSASGPLSPAIPARPDGHRPPPTRSREIYQTGEVGGPYSARHGAMRVTLPVTGEVLDGRYEIVSEIGSGGFGAVYRAKQRGLDKEVALKVLLPQVASIQDASQRFRREAMLAKELRHPNTITVSDYGQTEDGLTYIAMELLEGHTLEEILSQHGAMPPARVRRIANQVLKSLAEAHARGIVHRDLKPSNVMLVDVYGEKDFVKVLDFGIARAFEEHAESFKTQTGTVIGTPQYMAPEQLRGGEVGPEADLYALGLILVEMLTGKPVYNEENTNLVIVAQLSPTGVPIPDDVLEGPLGYLIYLACAKEVRHRWGSALAMLEALEQERPAPGRAEREKRESGASGPVLHSVDTRKRPAARPPRSKAKLVMWLVLVVLTAGVIAIGVLIATRPGNGPNGGETVAQPAVDEGVAVAPAPVEEPDPVADEARVQADRNGAIVANTVWRTASSVTLSSPSADEVLPGRVRLVVLSEPRHADVYRGETLLGETPFNDEVDAGSTTEMLTVRRRGYADQVIVVDLTRDAVPPTVELQRPAEAAREARADEAHEQPVEPRNDERRRDEARRRDSEPSEDGVAPEPTIPILLEAPPRQERQEPEEAEASEPLIPTL